LHHIYIKGKERLAISSPDSIKERFVVQYNVVIHRTSSFVSTHAPARFTDGREKEQNYNIKYFKVHLKLKALNQSNK